MEKARNMRDFLSFQTQRRFKSLFRTSISILEHLQASGRINDQEFNNFRKEILDVGNEHLREMLEDFDKVHIDIPN